MTTKNQLLEEIAEAVTTYRSAGAKTREIIAQAQKKSPKKLILVSLLSITTTFVAGSLYTTNQSLKQENQVLREQSAPSYQHVNTITYEDPICSDNLTVIFNGKPVCRSI